MGRLFVGRGKFYANIDLVFSLEQQLPNFEGIRENDARIFRSKMKRFSIQLQWFNNPISFNKTLIAEYVLKNSRSGHGWNIVAGSLLWPAGQFSKITHQFTRKFGEHGSTPNVAQAQRSAKFALF